ncbi:hypothetical protein MNAN1_002204 [Malassezia nana]|uniref:Bromodomain associated domain-containing protein n=1 Tax=Malassezia nana TaxID=180528 RepID=A0AAF0EKR4_9BASI|nr:hypothetical protein MNAN1_002204 [Malassezia nana]
MAATEVASLRKAADEPRPAADFAQFQMQLSAFALLSCAGFQGSSATACHVLAELMQRYMALLARTAGGMAHDAGRTHPNLWDISSALEHVMGPGSVDELVEWTDDEDVWKRSTTDLWPSPVQQQQLLLREYMEHVRAPSSERVQFVFEQVDDPGLRAELEVRQAVETTWDDAWVWGDMEPDADGRAHTPPPSSSRTQDTYILDFLPPLPTASDWQRPAPAPQAIEASPTAPATAPLRPPPPRAASVHGVPPADEVGDDGVRRVWRRCATAYAGVPAGPSTTRSELPSLAESLQRRGTDKPRSVHKTTSSLDAFMHAMDALESDPASRRPMYLTALTRSYHTNPTSAAAASTAYKRRRLAHSIADPQRYVPNDSMHGCVHVHPLAPASAPAPSLLITIPPARDGVDEETHSATAAPIFTPVHPHGRAVALVPPAGAQFPTLSYRHPSHLYYGARMLAYPDMQRAFARLHDPPALLDDHHTEQVYHGMAASRTLLTGTMMSVRHRDTPNVMVSRYRGANSILHASLERLRFHLATELEAARRAAQAEGQAEVEEPIRGERIQMPVKGTLVYAWDWPTAEP